MPDFVCRDCGSSFALPQNILDRYIAYRASTGRPMSKGELMEVQRYAEALDGYGPEIAKSIALRAERAESE